MNRKDIDTLWFKALRISIEKDDDFTRYEFAALIEQHLIESGYRRCAEGQRVTQHCAMVEEAVQKEREEMQKIAEAELSNTAMLASMPPQSSAAWNILQTIRARGEA